MSFLSQDMPTFDHYAFNLRDGLRKAAVTSLSELEESISAIGYGWLDSYMDQILDRQNRAPITELMKTPSRTQTVKKTRATTAAAKDRNDKVKGLNVHLAPSPSNRQNVSRQALSPLQPRSLNVSTLSPTPIASPKANPLKSKVEKAKAKPKAKKGKSKKTVENDENSPPTSASTSLDNSASISTTSSEKSKSSRKTKDDVKEKSNSSRSKKQKEKVEEPIEVEMAEPTIVQDIEEVSEPIEIDNQPKDIAQGSAISLNGPAANAIKESTVIADNERNSSSSARSTKGPITSAEQVDSRVTDDAEEVLPQTEVVVAEVQSTAPSATAETAVIFQEEPEREVEPEPEPERKVDPTMPTSFALPTITTGAVQPIRQVRSSWLSKALGTGAVPISGLPMTEANSAIRQSFAAPNQRQSTTMNLNGMRKSLVPPGGLKRKSDQARNEEDDDSAEEKRPEKTAKVVIEIPVPDYTDALPARTPGPLSRPNMPSKTPSFGTSATTSQPNSQGRSINPLSSTQNENQRSDIHRVTKALDELREKTAAKELAKQKAALAASTNAARMPQAKSTGTGFLRGLGSIGAGLLGLGGSGAEEEAQRLARELEEERLAEVELERLMKEATKADSEQQDDEEATVMEIDPQPKIQQKTARSTTPDLMLLQKPTQPPMSPEEEEDMVEEQSVMEELLPIDSRNTMAGHVAVPIEIEQRSTTPTGTPTRPLMHHEAPALHGREDKQVHQSSVTVMKEKERLALSNATEQKKNVRKARESSVDEDEEMQGDDEEDELDELYDDDDEEEEEIESKHSTRGPPAVEIKTHRKMPSLSSNFAPTPLNMSTSSVVTTGSVLGQANSMAAKALGVKPATGPVKSVQLAAAAAKKEQATIERKTALKEAEAKRQALAKKKAEEERIRADEERKAKVLELEEKRRLRIEYEKRKKEREDKTAQIAKEKADKEKAEKEAQAAKLRAAEEEAARKRKIAAASAALNKSQNGSNNKRVVPLAQQANPNKGKELFKPSKQPTTLGSSTSIGQLQQHQQGKLGPSVFRVAESSTQTQSSTITLVPQNQTQNGERKALGPPSRPSSMQQQYPPHQPMRQSNAVPSANNVLQQSRVALQSQLDEKAAMIQSEDIVLPDIASEYSDSDDEDRTKDFIPPSWAESPQLRAALEAQSLRNPDELFGPIKPLNMEELFKVRTNKFRARTSSANWSKNGDGLTKAEEVEYAKRMGFKSVPSGLGN
ncbi:uncharacterized protein IL334_005020 [Kwoniella shivajii]|uniref:Inner centromere protein ARK-binding domain-containing protein n=1 Tax=Kwoniella shivajii TaxID=564305 RepID=A0ABZ1D3R1_9TREE|nr:hypothetical protein IL334_005020 [Kwoniella shivajii]